MGVFIYSRVMIHLWLHECGFFSDWNGEAGHTIRLLGKVQSKQMVGAHHFGRNHTRQSCEINLFM